MSSAQVKGSRKLRQPLPQVTAKLKYIIPEIGKQTVFDKYNSTIRKFFPALDSDTILIIAQFLWQYHKQIWNAIKAGKAAIDKVTNYISEAWKGRVKSEEEKPLPKDDPDPEPGKGQLLLSYDSDSDDSSGSSIAWSDENNF